MPISSTTINFGPDVLANSIIQERISRSMRIDKERGKLYIITYDMIGISKTQQRIKAKTNTNKKKH